MRRVDQAIRRVIGEALSTELKDPRVGFVTVTDVKTSPDLRHARVYVSVLEQGAAATPAPGAAATPAPGAGGGGGRDETLAGLRSAHGFLQGRVAAELRLKRTPTLEFSYDDTTDRAMRVEALIEAHLGAPTDEDEHA